MLEQAATNTFLPAVNAALNGIATILLLVGFYMVKVKRFEAHKKVMGAAFAVSAVFLANYLYYHFNYEANRFGAEGLIRVFYFAMLISHVILATAMVPFILRLLYLALRQRFKDHARLARWVWPVWIYTSFTGVLIYFMLYQWFPAEGLR